MPRGTSSPHPCHPPSMDVSAVAEPTPDAPSEPVAGFRPGPVGLTVVGAPDLTAWRAAGTTLRRAAGAVAWAVGDWLRYGERQWGKVYAEALVLTGLDYDTLACSKRIAARFEFTRRRVNLSFGHHVEVAALSAEAADALLDAAETQPLSRNQLRAIVQAARAAPVEAPEPPEAVALACAVKAADHLRAHIDALLVSDHGAHLLRHLQRHHADVAAVVAALAGFAAESATGFAEEDAGELVGVPLNRLWGAG